MNAFQHQLLNRLCNGIGTLADLVENLTLTQQRLSQLGLFYQMGQALVSTFDLPQLLQDTMQLAASVINTAAASLMLVDAERHELVFAAVHGTKGAILRSQRISMDEGIAGWVARSGEPVIANDVAQDDRFSRRVDVRTGFLTRSILAVPMQIRGRTIGVLEVLNKQDEEQFDEEDLRILLTLAAEAAIAIENARLVQALREERDRILSAQEEVRRELNRKLHDGTVQLLAAIAMGIDHVERLLQLKPDAVYAELDALRKLTRQATREARLLLFELRPVVLETQGLVPALTRYVQQLQQHEPFQVHFDDGGLDKPVDQQVAGAIFSIVQEAVNNTRKYASAHNFWIRLGETDSHLVVHIEDDGIGFDVATVDDAYDELGSFGLLNMRERAALIEGTLTIESSEVMPEQGTLVTLKVPLSRALVPGKSLGPRKPEL
jgi:signal transduction histidine kinase